MSGEGALLLGADPSELQSRAHEMGPGSFGALGAQQASPSNGSRHDGRAVERGAHYQGDRPGLIGETIQAGEFERAGGHEAWSRLDAVIAQVAHCR